jgi:opacity protein-like surface antigen
MNIRLQRAIPIIVLAAVLLISAATPASAVQRRTKISDRGFYLSFYVPFNSVAGEFDDDIYLRYNEPEARHIYVPDLDAGMGFGFGGGIKFSQASLEVSYLRTTHDATVNDYPRDAVLNMANIDLKYHFLPRSSTQPYVLIGMCIPWMKVDYAASNEYGDIISDARYRGYGLNIGGGVTLHLNSQLAFTGGAVYRWIGYNHFEGIYGDELNWDNSIDGSGLSLQLGVVLKIPWDY